MEYFVTNTNNNVDLHLLTRGAMGLSQWDTSVDLLLCDNSRCQCNTYVALGEVLYMCVYT